MLQAKSREDATSEVPNDLESQINAIHGGGRPLAESERAYFEPRIGADFSQVRLHTDSQAAKSARAVNARAFTVGPDVVFGAGQYAPESSTGQRLMAHELTHVLQQTQSHTRASYFVDAAGDGHWITRRLLNVSPSPTQLARERWPRWKRITGLEQCVEGEVPAPRSLAEAIRRRQIDPDAPADMGFLSDIAFLEFLSSQGLERRDFERLSRWSSQIFRYNTRLQNERSQQGEDLYADFYSRGRNRARDRSKWQKRPQPGEWFESFAMGGGEFIVDLGRGTLHIGRYSKATVVAIWDPSELRELARDDVAFIGMVVRVITDPVDTVKTIGAGYAATYVLANYLTPEQQQEIEESISDILPTMVKKKIGKYLAKKLVISAMLQPVLSALAKRVTSALLAKGVKKAGGAVLVVVSILGLMEKAKSSSDRLAKSDPRLHAYLVAHDLHMAWFLVEDHVDVIRRQVRVALGKEISG